MRKMADKLMHASKQCIHEKQTINDDDDDDDDDVDDDAKNYAFMTRMIMDDDVKQKCKIKNIRNIGVTRIRSGGRGAESWTKKFLGSKMNEKINVFCLRFIEHGDKWFVQRGHSSGE